jgi:hypothetical protein
VTCSAAADQIVDEDDFETILWAQNNAEVLRQEEAQENVGIGFIFKICQGSFQAKSSCL